jgi:hypothetical protein
MHHRTILLGSSLFATAGLLGCRTVSDFDVLLSANDRPATLQAGAQVALLSGAACNGTVAATFDDLLAGRGEARKPGQPEAYTVGDVRFALPSSDAAGFLAVELRASDGSARWLATGMGQPLRCLAPMGGDAVEAAKLAGKQLVFTPHASRCTAIRASGSGVASLLLDSPDPAVLTSTGLVDLAGGEPIVGFENGSARIERHAYLLIQPHMGKGAV